MTEHEKLNGGLILGIDVGSVSISVVALDSNGNLQEYAYRLHQGNIRKSLIDLLKMYRKQEIIGVATPSGKSHFKEQVEVFEMGLPGPVTVPPVQRGLGVFWISRRSVSI